MGVGDSDKIDRLCYTVTVLQFDFEPRTPEKNFYIIYIFIYINIGLDFDFYTACKTTVTL